MSATTLRHDWTIAEVEALFALPFMELMFRAQEIHRANQPANAVQMSTLLSIKTGGCPEDCAYCPQSVRYDTGLEREKLVPLDEVRTRAKAAKDARPANVGAVWTWTAIDADSKLILSWFLGSCDAGAGAETRGG
jgi:biotin synthase